MAASELLPDRDDPTTIPVGADALSPVEQRLLEALLASRGRVITRTELARAAGLRHQPRRVDAHLVGVRRFLGAEAIRNVRGRGWMLVDAPRSEG